MSDVIERLIRYCKVPTPSNPANEAEVPSNPEEHDLARLRMRRCHSLRLGCGEAFHECEGRLAGHGGLVDIGGDDIHVKARLAHELDAARRLRGKNEVRAGRGRAGRGFAHGYRLELDAVAHLGDGLLARDVAQNGKGEGQRLPHARRGDDIAVHHNGSAPCEGAGG